MRIVFSPRPPISLAVVVVLATTSVIGTSPVALAGHRILEDPRGDGHGPGTYEVPTIKGFKAGSFDIMSVEITSGDEGAEIRVTMAGSFEHNRIRTAVSGPERRVFVPMVDVYFTDPDSTMAGHEHFLPGRRVTPQKGTLWHKAVVLSALPDLLSDHYNRAASTMAHDVCFARNVRISGSVMTAHVPRGCLPHDISKVGIAVMSMGLGSGAGFQGMVGRMTRPSSPENMDPWVRPVTANVGVCSVWEDGLGPSPCTFGGCKDCEWHPFVMDVVLPSGANQKGVLRNYSATHRRLAEVPFVMPDGAPGPAMPVSKPDPRFKVKDVRDKDISLDIPVNMIESDRYPPGTLGAIICPGEKPGGTVVVKGRAANFLVLEKVGDDSPVCNNAEVLF